MLSNCYQLNPPTSNRASTLHAQMVMLMDKHNMAHSNQTAERWYQMKDTAQDSVDAYRTIQNVRRKSQPQQQVEKDY